MNPKIKTQDVARNLYTNYLKRSDECFTAAKESLAKGDWNAAAIGAIHSGISAGDALCIYFLGKRHAGPNHRDAVVLLDIIKSGNILEIFLLLAPSFPVSVPRIYAPNLRRRFRLGRRCRFFRRRHLLHHERLPRDPLLVHRRLVGEHGHDDGVLHQVLG